MHLNDLKGTVSVPEMHVKSELGENFAPYFISSFNM